MTIGFPCANPQSIIYSKSSTEGSDPFGEKVNILHNIAMRLGRKVIDRQKKMYISINQFCGGLRGLARFF